MNPQQIQGGQINHNSENEIQKLNDKLKNMEVSKKFEYFDKLLEKSKKDLDANYKKTIPKIANLTEQEMQLEMKKAAFYRDFAQKENEEKQQSSRRSSKHPSKHPKRTSQPN